MIEVKQKYNGVESSLIINNTEVEADKKQVLAIIEKSLTVIEIKDLKIGVRLDK